MNSIRLILSIAILSSAIHAQELDTSSILSRVDTILNTIGQTKKTTSQELENNPSFFFDLFNQANDIFCRQDFDRAIELYKKTIAIESNHEQPFLNLGVCYIKKNQPSDAIPYLERAVELNPNYVKAHYHLGKSYKELGDTQRAQIHLQHAIDLDESCLDAQLELGHLLQDKHKFNDAIKHLRIAHQLQPDNLQITFDVANALNMANKTEEALEMYFEMNKKHPHVLAILYNIGYTLKKLNRIQEAMPYYQAVLERDPNHAEARFSRSLAYLIAGDFERGWADYEWRTNRPSPKKTNNDTPDSTLWDGSPLNGRIIILHSEQGLGDTFQFIRFARLAHERGGHVIAFVQSPVVDIISQCPYIEKVYALGSPVPPYHVQAPIMSLPYILHITQETIPTYDSYLHADEKLVQTWKEKLADDHNFKVGICWQGNSEYATPFLRAVVAAKSTHLNTFAPLAQVPGVSFYSLQKVTGENQLNDLDHGFELKTFDGDFDKSHGRFMDTAAVIKNLDLVISIDTSICHFAAGLGTETWTLLPNPPDWRWMLDREDTPWYPNMRLFRQPKPGDWNSVIQQVKNELNKKVHATKAQEKTYIQEVLSEIFDALIRLTIIRESTGNTTLDSLISEKQEQLAAYPIFNKNGHMIAELAHKLTHKTIEFFALNNKLHTLTENIIHDDELIETARELYECAIQRKQILEQLDAL